jgi:predicted enzyme related to lactoylglutathione lyase
VGVGLPRFVGKGHDGAVDIGLVLDSRDPEALAPFWAAALGYKVVGVVENYVKLVPDGREGPQLLLQLVPEHKASKNRMHLDIKAPDLEGLAARLEELGGTRLSADAHVEHDCRWIVMADPEGNEFCLDDARAR